MGTEECKRNERAGGCDSGIYCQIPAGTKIKYVIGTMGLIRGVSDYDELCADDIFWQFVTDADNYELKEL